MKNQHKFRHAVIERFMDKTEEDAEDSIRKITDDSSHRIHIRRFMKVVESRKQQILDKILLD